MIESAVDLLPWWQESHWWTGASVYVSAQEQRRLQNERYPRYREAWDWMDDVIEAGILNELVFRGPDWRFVYEPPCREVDLQRVRVEQFIRGTAKHAHYSRRVWRFERARELSGD